MTTLNFAGRRVGVRVDLNVPLEDGRIVDDRKLQAIIPTLQQLQAQKAHIFLLSHLGRPTESSPQYSLRPLVPYLERALQTPIIFEENWLKGLSLSSEYIVLCENVRFHTGETTNCPLLAAQIARLMDIFVFEAFACSHRRHASTLGISQRVPTVLGVACQQEIQMLQVLKQPRRPFIAVISGAKMTTKASLLRHALALADKVIVGGGIATSLLALQGYEVGRSLVEKTISLSVAESQHIILPEDVCVLRAGRTQIVASDAVESEDYIGDLGPQTLGLIQRLIAEAGTVLWNGPVGWFENPLFAQGTYAVATALATTTAYTIAGGGETSRALQQIADNKIDYISTGGGALLAYWQNKSLPLLESCDLKV